MALIRIQALTLSRVGYTVPGLGPAAVQRWAGDQVSSELHVGHMQHLWYTEGKLDKGASSITISEREAYDVKLRRKSQFCSGQGSLQWAG